MRWLYVGAHRIDIQVNEGVLGSADGIYSTTGGNRVLGRAGTPHHLQAAAGSCGGSPNLPNRPGWTNPVTATTSPLWTVSTLMANG